MSLPVQSAEAWNGMIAALRRSLVVSVTEVEGTGWRHPWTVRPQWDPLRKAWVCTIRPGFVVGLDASVEALVSDVTLETRERLKRGKALPAKQDATVDAWLTEKPLVRLKGWRAIGPDATATSATSNPDGSISLAYEAVPDFFKALGVGDPPAIQFTAGILTEQTSMDPESNKRRLLRALDVVLKQDRVGTATQWTTGAGLDGSFAQFDVITVQSANFRVRSYIDLESQWTPPAVASLQDRLTGNWTDDTTDERLVATVYLVSPEGMGPGQEPDGSWGAYVKHRLFWNLTHATNYLRPPGQSENLVLQTGLAGGVGDALNQFILAQVNDANSAAAQFLGREGLAGRFWTV